MEINRAQISGVVRMAVIVISLFGAITARAWVSQNHPIWPQGNIVMQLQLDATPPAQTLMDGSTTWNQVAAAALTDWNQYLTTSHFTWVTNSSAAVNSSASTGNGYNNVFWSTTVYGESWGAQGSEAVGIAITWYDDTERTEGDVIFNSTSGELWNSYRGAIQTQSGSTINDLRRVALHEFGHVLGLGHPDLAGQTVSAVMNSQEGDVDDLTADDIAGGQHFYAAVLPPVISSQPIASQSVAVGAASSNIGVQIGSGTPPFTIQWYRDNVALTGSTAYTSSSFYYPSVSTDLAGTYTAVISNSAGSVTTNGSVLTVTTAATAPSISRQPTAQTVTVGDTASFSVSASGTTPLSYQWQKNGAAITGATSATYSISNVQLSDAGNYSVSVSNSAGSVTSDSVALTVNPAPTGPTAWLSNLSVRANMASGQTMIVGFTVAGGAENVLVRAGGPALANTFPQYFTAASVMADPRLAYYPSGASTAAATNDNWDSSLSTTFSSVGAFPFVSGSTDAAFVQSINGPNNTVWVQGTGPGYVLVEGYGLGTTNAPRLTNISARNHVGTGADILIAGFVIKGSGTKRLLIRGIGPRLQELFGLTGVLADPKLEIYDSSGTMIAQNNDWDSSLSTVFDSVGAYSFTAGSKDSAIVVTLAANASYTAQVKGNDGGTGEAVVEVYELP